MTFGANLDRSITGLAVRMNSPLAVIGSQASKLSFRAHAWGAKPRQPTRRLISGRSPLRRRSEALVDWTNNADVIITFGTSPLMFGRIEDYALIGDCETAALVSKDGSIDWLCWPRFDSGACFAALLGDANNGRWRIAPAATGMDTSVQVRRRYRGDTLILETEFTTDGGTIVVIDFMPVRGGRASSHLVRMLVGKYGTVPMRSELIVRFGHGGWAPWVTRSETGDLLAIAGPDMLHLRTPVDLRGEGLTTVGDFTVSAGQRVPFVLTYVPSHLPLPDPVDADEALQSTEEFWRSWVSTCPLSGDRLVEMLRKLSIIFPSGNSQKPTTARSRIRAGKSRTEIQPVIAPWVRS
jgi:GH15 family glucan-1,4-alpha-glucosidase